MEIPDLESTPSVIGTLKRLDSRKRTENPIYSILKRPAEKRSQMELQKLLLYLRGVTFF